MSGENDRESESVVSDELLKLLVCPVDHADLRVESSDLVCTRCGRRFPVEDGIPNMLIDA
jgi:uncharacterized protein YbaR (Trm112 family)